MKILKPQDVVVLLKLCATESAARGRPPLAVLAAELGLSASEVHGAIARLRASGLLVDHFPKAASVSRKASVRPNTSALIEFLVHGLKYVFPPTRGELTRGVPTSYAAKPLNALIAKGKEPPPVWPDPEGTVRGTAFEPLYRTVPMAARRDPALHELLAIADALRDGRARDRKLAEDLLRKRVARHVE